MTPEERTKLDTLRYTEHRWLVVLAEREARRADEERERCAKIAEQLAESSASTASKLKAEIAVDPSLRGKMAESMYVMGYGRASIAREIAERIRQC